MNFASEQHKVHKCGQGPSSHITDEGQGSWGEVPCFKVARQSKVFGGLDSVLPSGHFVTHWPLCTNVSSLGSNLPHDSDHSQEAAIPKPLSWKPHFLLWDGRVWLGVCVFLKARGDLGTQGSHWSLIYHHPPGTRVQGEGVPSIGNLPSLCPAYDTGPGMPQGHGPRVCWGLRDAGESVRIKWDSGQARASHTSILKQHLSLFFHYLSLMRHFIDFLNIFVYDFSPITSFIEIQVTNKNLSICQ